MENSKKPTLVEDAYELIKQQILDNLMPPGFQAPEAEIAISLGMSRTPVREALLRLESEGLIELIPRRGARVLPVSAADMREIYEILTALEPEAAAGLARKGLSKDELRDLETTCNEMETSLQNKDLDGWAEADNRFHRLLLDLHGNKRLTTFIRTICDQAHRARKLTLRLRETPTHSTHEHREILNCIKEGDADGAREIFRQHRERTVKELLCILDNFKFPSL